MSLAGVRECELLDAREGAMDRRSATVLLIAMGVSPYVVTARAAEKVRRIGTLAPRTYSADRNAPPPREVSA